MLYYLVRAILASFLPLLPVVFRAGKLNDWTRSLENNWTPQYLSSGQSSNTSTRTQYLANGFDDTLTADSFLPLDTRLDLTHPLFESLVAVAHTFFGGFVIPSFWQLVLATVLLLLLPLSIWSSPATPPQLPKRALHLGQTAKSLDTLLSAPKCSDDGSLVRTPSTASPESPYPPIRDVAENLPCREMLLESPIQSSAPSSVPASPSLTELVSQILLPWYEEPDALQTVFLSGELPRSRSLSDIVEQSEHEDSDADAQGTPRFSGTSTPLQDLAQRNLAPLTSNVLSLSDLTLTDIPISADRLEPTPPNVPREETTVLKPVASDDRQDATPEPFSACVAEPESLSSATSVDEIEQDALSSTIRPRAPRSRRTSSILVSRLGMPGQQITLTDAGIEYAVSQLQAHTSASSTAREERRRLERVVTDVVDVFSESRGAPRPWGLVRKELRDSGPPDAKSSGTGIQRDIIDGQHNPPLKSDAQSRRPVYEVGRSRSGSSANVNLTSLVLLERTHSAPRVPASTPVTTPAVAGVSQPLLPRQRASTEHVGIDASAPAVRSQSAAPLSYAAVAAKPSPVPPPRPRVVSERPYAAVTSGPRGRSTSTGASSSTTPRRIHPLLASLLTPVPRRHYSGSATPRTKDLSQATPTPAARQTSGRTRHPSDSDNWRARRLAGDSNGVLTSESTATPPLRAGPSSFVQPPHKPSMGPSMLSVTTRAKLRDLVQQAQTHVRAREERDDTPTGDVRGSASPDVVASTPRIKVPFAPAGTVRPLPNGVHPCPFHVPVNVPVNVPQEKSGDPEGEASRSRNSTDDSSKSCESASDASSDSDDDFHSAMDGEEDNDNSFASDESVCGGESDGSCDDEVVLFAKLRTSKEAALEHPCSVTGEASVHATTPGVADGDVSEDDTVTITGSSSELLAARAPPLGLPAAQPALRIPSRLDTVDALSRIQELGSRRGSPEPAPLRPPYTDGLDELRARIRELLSYESPMSLVGSSSSAALGEDAAEDDSGRSPAERLRELFARCTSPDDSGGSAAENRPRLSGAEASARPHELSVCAAIGSSGPTVVLEDSGCLSDSTEVAATPPAPLPTDKELGSALPSGGSTTVPGTKVHSASRGVLSSALAVPAEPRPPHLLLLPPGPPCDSDFSERARLRRSTAPAQPVATPRIFVFGFDIAKRPQVRLRKVTKITKTISPPSAPETATPAVPPQEEEPIAVAVAPAVRVSAVNPKLERYDPWAFEQRPTVELGASNRGHQTIPHGLGKHQRAATVAARMRTQSAHGWFTGESTARERGFTGGRFDVLDSDVVLV